MAVASRGRTELPREWKGRETSPERTKVWTEPKPKVAERKVPVVYYLTRNGLLEHPHFMEVSLSSSEGLYLRDVINRLNFLRGNGMASMYSWSSKRSYKNGFVWHDLTEDDFIYPAHGHEYVLKGSELLLVSSPQTSQETASATSSSSSERTPEIPKSVQDDSDFSLGRSKKKTPWCSLDLNEYKVYKTESTADSAAKAADASTQTDEKRQHRRALIREEHQKRTAVTNPEEEENPTTELGRDEISPPPPSSSPETLETLIKGDCRSTVAGGLAVDDTDRTAGIYPSGRVRASAVLMHLISCGSIAVKDHGVSLVSQYRARFPRGSGSESTDQAVVKKFDGLTLDLNPGFPVVTRMEDKEYFSGSLIETKKKASDGAGDFSSLKRSSSYNADRCSKLDLAEKEIDGVRAKCMPRRPPRSSWSFRKESNGSGFSRSSLGSKRLNNDEPSPK